MKRILIVDDNVTILRKTEELLNSLVKGAVEILTATSGIEALRIISHCDIDLLITDYSMPHLNGLELIGELHNRLEIRKVLLTFSLAGFRDCAKIAEAGVGEILLKPVDEFRLKKVLNRYLWKNRISEAGRGKNDSENGKKNWTGRQPKSDN